MPIYIAIEIPDHLELRFDTPHARELCRAHSLAGLTNRIDDIEEARYAAGVLAEADTANDADRPVILQLRKGAADALRGAGLKVERHGHDVS